MFANNRVVTVEVTRPTGEVLFCKEVDPKMWDEELSDARLKSMALQVVQSRIGYSGKLIANVRR